MSSGGMRSCSINIQSRLVELGCLLHPIQGLQIDVKEGKGFQLGLGSCLRPCVLTLLWLSAFPCDALRLRPSSHTKPSTNDSRFRDRPTSIFTRTDDRTFEQYEMAGGKGTLQQSAPTRRSRAKIYVSHTLTWFF